MSKTEQWKKLQVQYKLVETRQNGRLLDGTTDAWFHFEYLWEEED